MLDLDLYTEPATMRGRLAGVAGFERSPIQALSVMHATRRAPRRDPASRACRIAVCYALDTGAAARSIVYGKVYPREVCAELAAGFPDARRPAWLRELDMLLWRFPHDPALPQLAELMDDCTELVHYRPEERATLKRHDPRGASATRYAKTFRGEEGAELCERFACLGQRASLPGAFGVAAPLGYDRERRTFWQQGVDAQPLGALAAGQDGDALMRAVARGLAHLHAGEPRFGRVRTSTELAAAAARRAAKIARCMPELGEAAARLAAAIGAHAPQSAPLEQIHGDFHLDQLRGCEGRLFVFDLDELAIGDPLEDLASFVVKSERGGDALIAAYARCRPQAFEPGRLAWHLGVQWLHKASRAYVWQRPGWRSEAARMLAAAERCIARFEERAA
jgi:hypothetical protein